MELAEGIVEVDTTGWAESWGTLSGRIKEGFGSHRKRARKRLAVAMLLMIVWHDDYDLIYLIDPKAAKNWSWTTEA